MIRHIIGRTIVLVTALGIGAGINHVTEQTRPSWSMYQDLSDVLKKSEARSQVRIERAEAELEQFRAFIRSEDEIIKNFQKELRRRDSCLSVLREEIDKALDQAEVPRSNLSRSMTARGDR